MGLAPARDSWAGWPVDDSNNVYTPSASSNQRRFSSGERSHKNATLPRNYEHKAEGAATTPKAGNAVPPACMKEYPFL
jgi:hypothetical protein